jgi:hypothetical protein
MQEAPASGKHRQQRANRRRCFHSRKSILSVSPLCAAQNQTTGVPTIRTRSDLAPSFHCLLDAPWLGHRMLVAWFLSGGLHAPNK